MHFEDYLENEKLVRGHLVDSFLCAMSREDWLRSLAPRAEPATQKVSEPGGSSARPGNSPGR